MQPLKQSKQLAADPRLADPFRIYWLAYLLTGQREPSLDVALEAIDLSDDANPFFSTWMLAWSRRLVIAKALPVIRDELAASARRTASMRDTKPTLPQPGWALDRRTTKIQLDRALLAIDPFPRCALLLSIFEGMALEDAAILLDVDQRLVRKGQIAGLRELTRNLAKMQGCISTPTKGFPVISEVQHA